MARPIMKYWVVVYPGYKGDVVINTYRRTTWLNPCASFVGAMQKRHGKAASFSKSNNRLYLVEQMRSLRKHINKRNSLSCYPSFVRVNNYSLGINMEKELCQN